MTEKCPVCNAELLIVSPFGDSSKKPVNCEYCGSFTIDENNSGLNSKIRPLIAGYLYETKDYYLYGEKRVEHINKENVEKLLTLPIIPKTHMGRINKLLIALYRRTKNLIDQTCLQNLTPQIAYVETIQELGVMLEMLNDKGYIDSSGLFTIPGLEYAESLISTNKLSTKVFIAMKFSDDKNSIRDKGIKPACENCGFEAFTVDEEEHNGDITDKIIAEIKTSRFIIADFTDNNLGVYYEAGYAKGLGIPVIKTCKKAWFDEKGEAGNKLNKLHFDIEHDNLILWENEKDLAERLEARIRATIL